MKNKGKQQNQGKTIKIKDANGQYHVLNHEDVINAARKCITSKYNRSMIMDSASAAREYVQIMLGSYEQEVFLVLFLDNKHRLIEAKEMFYGTIDGASVYPREVVKASMACNAAAVIFAHNHPSGASDPSQADLRITERLQAALEYVDVRVLDHLIVGEDVLSMAAHGLLT